MPSTTCRSSHPLTAAKPVRTFFDPWNSSSTGHQRAENRLSGSISWRDSRTLKLGEQFKDSQRGGRRLADLVGAGSKEFGLEGRAENGAWERGAKRLRAYGQRSIWEAVSGANTKEAGATLGREANTGEVYANTEARVPGTISLKPESSHNRAYPTNKAVGIKSLSRCINDDLGRSTGGQIAKGQDQQIFRNVTVYVNGSTYPLISDHKLKQILASHGARLSISFGRRNVTHVILGRPNGSTSRSGIPGSGGGLAATKLQKEITTACGSGIKFVGAEWVIESIKAGKRLPEARFASLKVTHKRHSSVKEIFNSLTLKHLQKDDEDEDRSQESVLNMT